MRRCRGGLWVIVGALAAGVMAGCGRTGPTSPTQAGAAVAAPETPTPAPQPPAPRPAPTPVGRLIWGRVLDADTRVPVAGARVSLRQSTTGADREIVAAVTTGDGRFNVTGTTLGVWWVAIERDGYEAAAYHGDSEAGAGFDFTGDVTLRVNRIPVLRPGESLELMLFNEVWSKRCGPESFLWCRRVVIESDGREVEVEASAEAPVLLADAPDYQEWDRDYAHQAVTTTTGGVRWVVRQSGFFGDPPVRVRLTVRPR